MRNSLSIANNLGIFVGVINLKDDMDTMKM